MNDHDLLQEYVRQGSQSAFTQLVERHLPLVWSAAWRQLGDAHLAQDVAQQTFTLLAQKSAALDPRTIVSGWLYRTTSHLAARMHRTERRRHDREHAAHQTMNDSDAQSTWRRIEPLLDDAMASLDERDRDAVVLRYFENRSLKEVGAALGTNDDAAQKRLSRAIEKLRRVLAQRGETVAAGTVIAAIGAGAIQSAPAALVASTLSGVAIATAATATVTPIATLNLLSWTMIKPALVSLAVVALTATAFVQRHTNRSLRAERDEAVAQLSTEKARPAAAATTGISFADSPEYAELLLLRAQAARLRTAEAELARLKAALAAAQANLGRPAAEPAPETAQVPDERTIKISTNLKQIGLGLRLLSNEQGNTPFLVDNRLSPQLISLLGGNETSAMRLFENVTLLVSNSQSLAQMEQRSPWQIVARTINATSTPDGRWRRLYLLADGSVTEKLHGDAQEIMNETKH